MSKRTRRAWLFAAFSIALTAPGALAQSFQINTTQVPPSGGYTENVDFADVDLDGDWDAVFANGGDFGNQQNVIWINLGGLQGGTLGFFQDETAARLPAIADTSRDVEFADLDGDGDFDLHVSNVSDIVNQPSRWWINMGAAQGGTLGFFQDQTAARWVGIGGPGSSIPPAQVLGAGGFVDYCPDSDFGDLDADGDLDLVHASYGGFISGQVPTRIFVNDGNGFFSEFNPSLFQLTGSFIANGDPGIWCEGFQQANTTNSTGQICDIATTGIDLDVGDTDGDLDLDILHGARNELPRMFANRREEKLGILGFRDVTGVVFPPNYATGQGHYEQEMGDCDNDGDLDIYGLNWHAVSFALNDITLRNDGDGTFSNLTVVPGSGADEEEADFLDYDGDGDLDVFVANFSGKNQLYRNDFPGFGNFSFTNVTASQMPPSLNKVARDADCCDLDGDGDYDVVVANSQNQSQTLYTNVTQVADAHAPRIPNLQQVPDRSTSAAPTVVRAQVYDNAPYYVVWYHTAVLQYSVNGGAFVSVPMITSQGQVFRGEIPGQLAGTIDYRVRVRDEHGNTGVSATRSFMSSSSCNGNVSVYCTAKVNSQGCTPAIGWSGTPSAGAGSGFAITATNIVAMKFGILAYSKTGPAATPFQGGIWCSVGPFVRTPARYSGGSVGCSGSLGIDFNAWVASGVDPALVAGAQFWAQWWYRDPASPSTTGLTDALEATLCP
jgi:hypothetical protein